MRSDGNQEKGDRIHAETDGWQLPRVRSRILRSYRDKNSGNRQRREQNEPSAPDNSIRVVCLFDHHKWAINGNVLTDQESHAAAALFASEALEVGHLAFHLFAGGVGGGAYALNAQLELVRVGGARKGFIER